MIFQWKEKGKIKENISSYLANIVTKLVTFQYICIN